MSDIIDHLQKLGLSEYEAKAYIATVVLGGGYDKGDQRREQGASFQSLRHHGASPGEGVRGGGEHRPRCYRANDPAEAFDHLIKEIESSRDEVVKALDEIGSRAEKRDNPIWTIKGEWAIDHKVTEMLESARRDVVIISLHNDYLRRYAKKMASRPWRRKSR